MASWRPAAGVVKRTLDAIPPASGAVPMGTGIVSIALSLDGHETISRVLLVLDVIVWLALAVLLPARAMRDRERFLIDVRTPAALTSVAGTAVLGTRLATLGWQWAGVALLVIALVVWAALLVPVLTRWRTPTVGASLVLTVSTESLAVLAATLAAPEHARWLLFAALGPFALGLVFYVFVIARFDLRQLGVGRGDHWITGGALAISTLAAARITIGESLWGAGKWRRSTQGGGAGPLGANDAVAAGSLARRGAASPAALQRAALVDRLPRWNVCRVQLRRWHGRPRGCDHQLRAPVGMGGTRGMGAHIRGARPARTYGHRRGASTELGPKWRHHSQRARRRMTDVHTILVPPRSE